MRNFILILFTLLYSISFSQSFIRGELSAELDNPWEITMGADGYLWLTESGGNVARVNPITGIKTTVFTAPDYFDGDISEQSPYCNMPSIGKGTLGLALHPQFFYNLDSNYIYFVHSYNAGLTATPKTNFKVVRLKWNSTSGTVTESMDIITNIPSGYDHLGGRLISAEIDGSNYLFLSIGDLGRSEDSFPDCYPNQADNPNNFTQIIDSLNGKIHRFNMDGTIPADNPIAGNSFYTRGHRNPQGLAFNPNENIIYDIEHGDRTDDEINILKSGMNYGWKYVRGYHHDGSFAGESDFVNNYVPNPLIENDQLVPPIHSWCTDTTLNGIPFADWCTIAPSDGEYYSHNSIHQWTNSLLVVSLKEGLYTSKEVHVMHLSEDGKSVVGSEKFFGEDQSLNGRLRDITFSLDGRTIYLINNWGADRDKITTYTYDPLPELNGAPFQLFPNPSTGIYSIISESHINYLTVSDAQGKVVLTTFGDVLKFSIEDQSAGVYFVKLSTQSGETHYQRIVKI